MYANVFICKKALSKRLHLQILSFIADLKKLGSVSNEKRNKFVVRVETCVVVSKLVCLYEKLHNEQ